MSPGLSRIMLRSLFGIALLFFFLPFTTLSCGGKKLVTLNGLQMATGTTLEKEGPLGISIKQETIKPQPFAILAGVAALAAGGFAFAAGKTRKLGAGLTSALSALSLLLMKSKVETDILNQTQGAVGIQWEFGFWVMLLATVLGTVLAFIPETREE